MSRCYTQITLTDRQRLHQLVAAKVPVNEMARQLGRHRSTIFREIKRNTFVDKVVPDLTGYYCVTAHDMACETTQAHAVLARSTVGDRTYHSRLVATADRWSDASGTASDLGQS